MKIKEGFNLRQVCGENVVTATGLKYLNFNKLLHLNASAAFLWEKFVGQEFTAEDLASALEAEYGIDKERALSDAEALVKSLCEAGVVE